PRSVDRGDPSVRRLFENFAEVEAAHYRATGIFPIMHVVALRRDVFDANPWVAANLLQAFEEAKRRSLARAVEATVPHFPYPWAPAHGREARELLGDDFWPYGLEPNRTTLEAFLDFALEQGVCRRRVSCEELFPAEVQTSFRV